MSVASVRVRRHAWPEAHEFLTRLGVTFSTGVTGEKSELGGGYVEVLLPAPLAPLLDRFPRVPRDWDDAV